MKSKQLVIVLFFVLILILNSFSQKTKIKKSKIKKSKIKKKTKNNPVKVLTPKNIDYTLTQHDFVFIKFYAPWCQHCKEMAPEFIELAKKVKSSKLNSKVLIAELNCDSHKKTCSKLNIKSYPTIKLFKKDNEKALVRDYEDIRKADSMFDYILKKTGPPVFTLSDETELNDFIEKNKNIELPAIVGFFKNKPNNNKINKLYEEYQKIGDDKDDFLFGQIFGEEIMSKFKIKKDVIKVFRSFDKDIEFNGKINQLSTWIESVGYPPVEEINTKTFQRFIDAKIKSVALFVNFSDIETKNKALNFITDIAKDEKKWKNKLKWGITDTVEYGQQLLVMGGNLDKTPALAGMDIDKRQNFPYFGKWDKEEITNWALKLAEGKLTPFLRSQEIPKQNQGNVKIVVGKTFNKYIYDKTKDVLLLIYAPWCQFSRRIAPIYHNYGKLLKNVKNLLIAEMDGDANDSPIEIKGFPTIIYFKKGSKDKPIYYSKNSDEKEIKKFILENASKNVKIQIQKILNNDKKKSIKDEL